jgi:hypothetical protein
MILNSSWIGLDGPGKGVFEVTHPEWIAYPI